MKSITPDCCQGVLVKMGHQNIIFNCLVAWCVVLKYVDIWNVDLHLSFCHKLQMSKAGRAVVLLPSAHETCLSLYH